MEAAQSSIAVLAVVLNWRTPALAERCVRSVLDSDFGHGMLKCIVVDNASNDGSVGHLRSCLGDAVEVIAGDKNLGYAGGMNIGLRKAVESGARYAFLLNADVEVHPRTIGALYEAAEDTPDGAFYGPRIFDVGKPRDKWFVGGRWDWGQGTIRVVRTTSEAGSAHEPRQIEFVNGAAMFVRVTVLEHTGVFDERFGLYFEESDLCCRAVAAGHTLWHVPAADVEHHVGASMAKSGGLGRMDMGFYYRTRNKLLWGRKNLRGVKAVVFWTNVVIRLPIKLLVLLLRCRIPQFLGVAAGIRDFVRGRFGLVNTDG